MIDEVKRKVARTVLLYLGLIFIFSLLWKSWDEIKGIFLQMDHLVFVLSILAGVPGIVVTAFLFNSFLAKHGIAITDKKAVHIHIVSQIAKYIPGKIWAIVYQASHIKGVPETAGVVMANMELMIAVMYMTSVIALVVLCAQSSLVIASLLLALGALGFVFLCRTSALKKTARAALKLVGKEDIYLDPLEDAKLDASRGLVIFFLFTLIYIVSYVLMLNAVFALAVHESLVIIALLSIAWIGGVLSLVFPAGVGIRELLFILFSTQINLDYSFEVLVSIALVTRLWQVLQEVTALALVFTFRDPG